MMKMQDDTQPIQKIDSKAGSILTVLTRFWWDVRSVFKDLYFRIGTKGEVKQKALELLNTQRKYDRLYRQINQLAAARRLFSLWHAVHIPLGLTLFMVALVHIGATIYYSILIY